MLYSFDPVKSRINYEGNIKFYFSIYLRKDIINTENKVVVGGGVKYILKL